MPRIKDLIKVPDVRTVIQMADIQDPELRQFLTESFVITEEVESILLSVFDDITREQGRGYFIKGNFGSGKSHLLGVISLLLNFDQSWKSILQQRPTDRRFQRLAAAIKENNYITINISLVEHSSREYLEHIIIDKIMDFLEGRHPGLDLNFEGEEGFIDQMQELIRDSYPSRLRAFLRDHGLNEDELFSRDNLFQVEQLLDRLNLPYRFHYNRDQLFDHLETLIKDQGYSGMVFLIDELSEFLRSKPDGRRFNEDIRFLQFLGERSQRLPLWILATLQEEIEKTGETTPEAFRKIKDRFSTHLNLSGEHIKELVSQRLIQVPDKNKQQVIDIFKEYKSSFPRCPFSRKDFLNLYPVHPLAIDLLDNLKPLFSQHRGIIDFIHFQIKGDQSRGIEGMLDKPAEELLTADKIFDHFLDRIRDNMETAPYYEKVYRYYEQEMDSLLETDQCQTGLRLIKLLILFSISPIDKQYTVEDIANMLFVRVTDLEPVVNYEYIDDILQRLYRQGAYLELDEGEETLNNCYQIDLEADINLIIKRKTEYIESNLFEGDQRIFTELGSNIKENYLPLTNLLANPRGKHRLSWQNTSREGFIYLLPFTEITIDNIKKSSGHLLQDEQDFMMVIGYPLQIEDQLRHLKEVLLPELSDREKEGFLFWVPEQLRQKGYLRQALARRLLYDEYRDKSSTTASRVRERLEELINEDREQINKIFRTAYFQGQILNGFQEGVLSPEDTGFLPFPRLLEKAVSRLLNQRFPYHNRIAPYQQSLTTDQIERLLDSFLKNGEIEGLQELEGRVLNVINSYLKPMGLIKKNKQRISLKIKPGKNPLIKLFFKYLEAEKTPLSQIYWQLRKGSYGLSWKQFKLLVYTLLYSGYLTAYSEKQKISLKRLNARNFKRIKYLGYGELIDGEFQTILQNCGLLPPRFKKETFSLPLQQEIWDYVIDFKQDWSQRLDFLEDKLKSINSRNILEGVKTDPIKHKLSRVKDLLEEIKVSYSSEEGLERFASQYRNLPHIDSYLEQLQALEEFLKQRLEDYRLFRNYLEDSRLEIPDGDKYRELRKLRQNLLTSLAEETLLYDEEFFEELSRGFNRFQHQYLDLYQSEHRRQLGPERFRPYQKIKQSRGYHVLSRLAEIEIISVKNDLVKIDRMISGALKHRCTSFSMERLRQIPVCDCGFQLGDRLELTSRERIQRSLESGIKEYIQALKSKEYREKVETYLENMEAVGEKRFARPIRELLTIKEEENLLEQLDRLLNRNLIRRLNQALSGDISLRDRDIDQLYENLVDRSFAPEQLRQVFEEWLAGEDGLRDKTYIRVVSGTHEYKQPTGGELEQYLDRYFPELLPVYRDLGSEEFIILLASCIWGQDHNLNQKPGEIAGQLLDKSPQTFQKLLAKDGLKDSLLELAHRLLEDQPADPCQAIREKVNQEGIIRELIDLISPVGIADYREAIDGERLSTGLLKKLTVYLIQALENRAELFDNSEKYLKHNNNIGDNPGLVGEEKGQFRELIDLYVRLQHSLASLEGQQLPGSYRQWQRLYRRHLSGLEDWFYRIRELARKLELDDRLPLSVKYNRLSSFLGKYQRQFKDFYESQQVMVAEPGDNDLFHLPELILNKYPELLAEMGLSRGVCLLLDGLRWDIWRLIRNKLDQLPLRLITEESLIARTPTNTDTQLEALREAGFSGEIIEENRGDTEDIYTGDGQSPVIVKFSYIDDKVHTVKSDYPELRREISFQTDNILIPFLENISSRTGILLFGDHGFTTNHSFDPREKYESPRYLHGGESLEEVIVPWAFYYKT